MTPPDRQALKERCRAICSQMQTDAMLRQGSSVETLLAFRQREAAEREACAKIVDWFPACRGDGPSATLTTFADVAAAIRRGTP